MGKILGMIGQGVSNLYTGIINNKLQQDQNEKLLEQQGRYNREQTDYNMQKQLEFWQKTGYGPQVEQMKAAGLNPAMMYGGGGQGGSTNVATSSSSGASAGANSMAPMDVAGLMQLDLLKAQKENIEADTEKKKVDAAKTAGVDTELAKTQLGKLAQETKSEEWRTKILEIDEFIRSIDKEISSKTMNMRISTVESMAGQAYEMLRQSKVKSDIDEKTEREVISQIRAESIGAWIENDLKRAEISLNREQQLELRRRVSNMIQENERQWQYLSNDGKRNEIQKAFNDIIKDKVETDQILNVIDGVLKVTPVGAGRNVIEGFKPKKSY